jgi:hypothetical protein
MIKANGCLDPRIEFLNDLSFLQDIAKASTGSDGSITETNIREYFQMLTLTQKRIFVRLLIDLEPNNCFDSPFKNLPSKYGRIIKDTFKRGENEKQQRDVAKTMISLEDFDSYLNNHFNIAAVLHNINFNEKLNQASETEWTPCNSWDLSPTEQIVYKDKENPHLAETVASGKILWMPDIEKISDDPTLFLNSINDVQGNKDLQIIAFLPKAFMESNSYIRIRKYLETENNVTALFKFKSKELNIDNYPILFTPFNSKPFAPFYSEVNNFKTLLVLLKKVLHNQALDFYLAPLDGKGNWLPVDKNGKPDIRTPQ